jgi:hypothetical protein
MADVRLHELLDRITNDVIEDGGVYGLSERDTINKLIYEVRLEVAGLTEFAGAHIRLVRALPLAVSADTVVAISSYLVDHVVGCRTVIVRDFAALVWSLRSTHDASVAALHSAQHASDVHSWQGNTAHHLLRASSYFAKVAQVLLKDDGQHASQLRYASEKLHAGQEELAYAERHWNGHD